MLCCDIGILKTITATIAANTSMMMTMMMTMTTTTTTRMRTSTTTTTTTTTPTTTMAAKTTTKRMCHHTYIDIDLQSCLHRVYTVYWRFGTRSFVHYITISYIIYRYICIYIYISIYIYILYICETAACICHHYDYRIRSVVHARILSRYDMSMYFCR